MYLSTPYGSGTKRDVQLHHETLEAPRVGQQVESEIENKIHQLQEGK